MKSRLNRLRLKKSLFTLVIVSLICLTSISYSSISKQLIITSSGTINYEMRPLHVDGRFIKDDLGRVIYLRGVVKGVCAEGPEGGHGAGSWPIEAGGESSGWGSWDPERVRWHFRNMKSFGFSVWRCFGWTFYMWKFKDTIPECEAAVNNMLEAIQIAGEEGLYVVAAPYAVSSERRIETFDGEGLPFPPYLSTTRGQQTITSEQDFIDLWVEIATALKDYPHVLLELYNEPHWDQGDWDTERIPARNAWFRVVNNTIDAIRAVTDLPIVVQWRMCAWYNDWNPMSCSDLNWVYDHPEIFDAGRNVVVSTHLYRQAGSLGGNDGSEVPHNYTFVKERVEYLFKDVHLHYPVFVGEVGCDMSGSKDNLTNELEAFGNLLTVFNELGVGYTAFMWRSDGIYAIFETQPWLPPLNAAGEILVDKVKGL